MKQRYPIVVVHSLDQAFYPGIWDPRTKEFTLSELCTVGHLLHRDDKAVVVASEYFDDCDVRYVSVIPVNAIIEMKVLYEPEEDK